MRHHHKQALRCAGGAAVIMVSCLPLTSCASESAQADAVGYVAIVRSHPASAPGEAVVNTVSAPEGAVPVQPSVEPIGPVPAYEVIAQRTSDRSDKATTYYVVLGTVDPAALGDAGVDSDGEGTNAVQALTEEGSSTEFVADLIVPVDPSTAAFKPAVRQVLRSLAEVNGGPDFTAHVWDEVTAAQTEVSFKSAPDLFSETQYAAKEAANAGHLVASYQGGVAQSGLSAAYVLFWFPDAGVTGTEGQGLMSSEVWRP